MKSIRLYRLLLAGFLVFTATNILLAQAPQPVQVDSVVILFNQHPDTLSVTKTPLKYNKAFAMSFQEDDSHVDIYNTAYPLFEGNGSTGGLYYTDGCGNSKTFKMSSAIYIFNGYHVDLLAPGPYHVPDYLTWPQLTELWEHGWGIDNHGISDPVTGHANYDIQRTQSYAKRKVNDSLYIKTFVQPNQGDAYFVPCQNNHYNGFISHGIQDGLNADEHGIDVNDTTIDWLQTVKINRIFDGNGYKNKADELYGYSQQGSNRWVPWGWHTTLTAAFSSELTQIYYTYGELGMDNILIAPDDEILDYLAVKQAVTVNKTLTSNRLTLTFSGDVPSDRRFYALTLKVFSDAQINAIDVYGTDDYSYSGLYQDSALINLAWDGRYYYPMEYLADSFTTVASQSASQYDAMVAMDYVILMDCGQQKDSLRDVLCSLNQQGWNPGYDAGFCDVLAVNIGNDTTVLADSCVQFSGPDGDYTYLWSTGDTTKNIEVCPETDTTVWLTISNNLNFCATDSATVFIHTYSFSLGPDTTICQGECISLAGPDSMMTYQWFVADTVFDTSQIVTVCPVDTTEYILEVTDLMGYVTSDTIVVNVLPIPEWSLAPDTVINLGECDSVFGPDGFAGYRWYTADTLYDTLKNIQVCPVDTTAYALVTTTLQGCESSDTIVYNVITLNFSLGSDTAVCLNNSITLTGPDSMEIYRWYESDTSNLIDTVQSITVSPIDTTMYILYVVDSLGAYNSDSIMVNVLPLPDASITFSSSACDGNVARIVVTPSVGYDSYIWHYNNQVDTSSFGVLAFIPNQSQNVVVEVVDSSNCITQDQTFVEVWPNPLLTPPNDTSACTGDSVTFIASGNGDIWWEDLLGNQISDTNYIITKTIADTVFIVKDTSAYGCLSTDSVTLTMLPLPEVVLHHPDTAVCAYTTLTLTGSGADSYVWFFNNSQKTGDTILFYTVDTTGFLLQGTSLEGCINFDTATVNVKAAPDVSAWGLLPAYCQNDAPDSLFGIPEGGVFSGSGMVGTIFTPSIAGTGEQQVIYTFTNTETCTGYDTLTTFIYSVGNGIDLGDPDTLSPGDTIKLDAGEGFDRYLWNTGDTTQILTVPYNPHFAGTRRYSVVGIINQCTSTGSVYITFVDPSGISEHEQSGITIYPNPFFDEFNLSFRKPQNNVKIWLFDIYGKVVYSETIAFVPESSKKTIHLNKLPRGVYFVKWQSGNQTGISKIVKKK